MEYYSVIKNDSFMNSVDKWMELENVILSEVTQTQEGKAIQRPPHFEIHPICRQQTRTLLVMPRSACRQEPLKAVSERLHQHLRQMQILIANH